MRQSNSDPYYDIPFGLVLQNCIQGANWKHGRDDGPFHSAIATFKIPLSFDNIFLISRGNFSNGIVNIITSSNQPKNSMSFNIVAKYESKDELNLTKACLFSRAGNQQGVGIFTTTQCSGMSRNGHRFHFETTVVLPEDTSPITIKGFETDVPNTSQIVQHLANTISFESLKLKGMNMPINVESLSAIQAEVQTTNANINGTFNTTSSLILRTTNAKIDVAVGLHDEGRPPSLVARTANAHLTARLYLTTPSGEGGKFAVDTSTSNAPLSVTFVDAPLSSVLEHKANTTNSSADVTLHPTYEGSFDVKTFNFMAELKSLPADDPSGQRRQRRTLVQSPSKNHIFGNSEWTDPQTTPSSRVTLYTANSPVVLNLSGN